MALVLKDRVKETSTTAGTGTITLAGAASGFQSFSAIGNGNSTYYAIVDPATGDWEVGIGTYTSSGTTLSRTTVLSSSTGGSLVPFAANTKDVFVTYPSEKGVWLDASGVASATSFGAITATSAALTSGTITTAPTNATDIVNKEYADSISSGLNYHQPVNYASTTTLPAYTYNNGSSGVGATITANANGALSLGGGSPSATQRVLIKDEVSGNAAYNGVYVVTQAGSAGTPFILTRATDYDTSGTGTNEIDQGDYVLVISGTNASTAWVQQTPLPITVGTTALTFLQFNAPITYNAGTGLNLSPATTFNITNTGVTASTYGSASAVPVFAVNAQGQITSVTNTNIAINGSAVSGNISGQAGSVANSLTAGTYLTGTAFNGSAAQTWTVDATSANTASKVVARDASGNFSAGTITAALSGNATTATTATNVAGGAANQIVYNSSAGTTTFAAAPSASGQLLNWNGSAYSWVSPIPTTSGGTGLTSFTSGGVVYASSTSALTTGSALTFDGTNLATTGGVILNNARYFYGKTSGGTSVRLLGINAGDTAYVGAIDAGPTSTIFNASSTSTSANFYASGSEQMRLTSTGLGIGTNSPAYKLAVHGTPAATSGALIYVRDTAAAVGTASLGGIAFFSSPGSDFYVGKKNNTAGTGWLSFGNANSGTEYMALDASGNLGIGTSSPAAKLDLGSSVDASKLLVYGSGNVKYGFGIQTDTLRYFVPTGSAVHSFGGISSADGTTYTERMRLDSSGNLGLGVTPSAWGSGYKALQISNTGSVVGTSGSLQTFNNAYDLAGTFKYLTNDFASRYYQYQGTHVWNTAPSGVAGNTVTFTQAMTLDASGNLGIGTSSPDARLHVDKVVTGSGLATPISIFSGGAYSAGTTYGIGFHFADVASAACPVGLGYVIESSAGDTNGSLAFYTRSSTTLGTAPSERARIDSSGNMGVGTTSPSTFGTFAVKTSLGSISIASGGSIGARLKFYDSSNTQTAEIINNGGSNELLQISATAATGSILFNTNSALRFTISSAGALGIGSTPSYGTSGQVLTSNGSGAAPSWQTSAAAAKGFAVGMSLVFGR